MKLPVLQPTTRRPRGSYPGFDHDHGRRRAFRATGEFRSPRRGEFYLSGAIIEAWRAPADLASAYWIAEPDPNPPCPTCGRRP